METHKRSMMKSLTWRIVGIVLLLVIAWFVTHDWKEMTIITIVFHSIRMVLYYVHERLWLRVKWGRVRHPLESLQVKGTLSQADLDEIRAQLRSMGYLDD